MPRKKKLPPLPADLPLRIYVTQTGAYIAGEEVYRRGPRLEILDPVFVSNSADGMSFDMQPVKFVAPGRLFTLYTYGLIGDVQMPDGMVAWYMKYQEQREEKRAAQP
jgi:hypothetical protein